MQRHSDAVDQHEHCQRRDTGLTREEQASDNQLADDGQRIGDNDGALPRSAVGDDATKQQHQNLRSSRRGNHKCRIAS